jgi:hypothetical protein
MAHDENPFELFSSYRLLATATSEINTGLDAAYRSVVEGRLDRHEAWAAHVYPVLERHRSGGALDTEPRHLTRTFLDVWLEKFKRPDWENV